MNARQFLGPVLITALVATVAGCPEKPDERDPVDDTDAGTVAADQFEEAALDVMCTALIACGAQPGSSVPFPDAAACRAFVAAGGLGGPSTFDSPAAIEASIAAGQIQYDAAKAKKCLDELKALDCGQILGSTDPLDTNATCREALVGKVAENGACITHAACGAGLFCSRATDEALCEGTCQKLGAGRCEGDEHCPSGERCTFGGAGGRDCVAPGAQGAACTDDRACRDGLYCRFGENGGTCEPQPGIGEACEGTCAGTAQCVPSREGGATCVAAPGEGAACVGGSCAAGLWCNFSEGDEGTCRARGQENEACQGSSCVEGFVCVGETNPTCRRRAAIGEACIDDSHCGLPNSLAYCDASTDKCTLLPGPTKPCATLSQFGMSVNLCNPLEAWCDESGEAPTCKAFKRHGAPCQADPECGGEPFQAGCVSGKCHRPDPLVCEP